ncbi:butyrophilin-like protein 2 isoform X4 [Trichomycterus rosablanca]|uniref:butyrophilin-like protein 2 isoform X4 n=1 Tax=Trichomycterus rosablanca TaxID=2290929 RepID=UPI002F35DD31
MFLLYICILQFVSCDDSFSEQPQINIIARVGSTALLPCKCNTEYLIPHVEWAIYFKTVFERLGDISYPGKRYEGRVDVPEDEMNKGNCSLVLKNVTVNDENIYRCYHPERLFGSLIQTVHLSVVGSFPEQPQINITARVGSTALLPCKCNTEYHLIPHVEWKNDNETVFEQLFGISNHGEGYEGRVDVPEDELNKGNCSLVLKNVTVNDEDVYKCYEVGNNIYPLKPLLIQTVHLSVDAKETTTQSSDSDSTRGSILKDQINVTARVGSTALLPCECNTEYHLIPHVEWKNDNETVFVQLFGISNHGEGYEGRVDVPEDELNKGNCSLVLKNVNVNDEKVYKCYEVARGISSFKLRSIQIVHLSVDGRFYNSLDLILHPGLKEDENQGSSLYWHPSGGTNFFCLSEHLSLLLSLKND